jgi:hypothetical protein
MLGRSMEKSRLQNVGLPENLHVSRLTWILRYTFLERTQGGKVESISLSLLTRAFRFSYDVDDGWEPQRVQSIVMSLVAQVILSFSLSHEHV